MSRTGLWAWFSAVGIGLGVSMSGCGDDAGSGGGDDCSDLPQDECLACCNEKGSDDGCILGSSCGAERVASCQSTCNGGTGAAGTGGNAGTGNAGTGNTGTGAGSNSGDAAQVCVDEINAYRATYGLPAYERWTDGEACASSQAQSDSQTGQAHGAFGQCSEWAQNECPGWPGPPATMIVGCLSLMWDEGPGGGHHDTMASSDYTRVACGFYEMPSGDVWAVQNFQ